MPSPKGIFPASWNVSLIIILYKENDPSDMANYRLISLCTTNYKLLARLLNHRMTNVAKQLINENQAGYVLGQFITQDALRCQVIIKDTKRTVNLAKKNSVLVCQVSKAIGLSLDQEKAIIELTFRTSDVLLSNMASRQILYKPLLHSSDSFHVLDFMLVMLVSKQNQTILQPSNTVSKMPIKVTQSQVKDLYQPNPEQPRQLKARKAPTIPVDIRCAFRKILKQVNENKVHIQPFFHLLLQPPQDSSNNTTNISFTPFVGSFDFTTQQGLAHQVSNKTFRTASIESYTSSIAKSN